MDLLQVDPFREAYGFDLPGTGLPWQPGTSGEWRVERGLPRVSSGYLVLQQVDWDHVVLRRGGTTWMSSSLHERESHAWHVHRATGRILVGGLGLGLYVHEILKKPQVERVLVVEKDSDVVELFWKRSGHSEEEWRRVEIVVADVLSPGISEVVRKLGFDRPDYAYLDIWDVYPSPAAPHQLGKLRHAVDPVEAGWWGQEAGYAEFCHGNGEPMSVDGLRSYLGAREGVVDERYVAFCEDVALAHGLQVSVPTP